MIIDGLTLWLAALMLTVQYGFRPVAGSAVVFTAVGTRLGARVSRGAIGLGRRRLDVPLPLGGIVIAAVLPLTPVPSAAVAPLGPFLASLRTVRLLSTAVLLLMFAGIPLLASRVGLPAALMWSAVPVYGLNLVQVIALRRLGSLPGLDRAPRRALTSDVLLCPPYGAALARRVAVRFAPAGDALATVRALTPGDAATIAESLRYDSLGPGREAELAAMRDVAHA